MPCWQSVYDWIDEDDDFSRRFARARERGFDAIALEALEIADTPFEGVETEESDAGTKTKRGDMLGHRKLQVETRLKLLAKWSPKKYGDKQAVELTGADGGPVTYSDTERTARLNAILNAAEQRRQSSNKP